MFWVCAHLRSHTGTCTSLPPHRRLVFRVERGRLENKNSQFLRFSQLCHWLLGCALTAAVPAAHQNDIYQNLAQSLRCFVCGGSSNKHTHSCAEEPVHIWGPGGLIVSSRLRRLDVLGWQRRPIPPTSLYARRGGGLGPSTPQAPCPLCGIS